MNPSKELWISESNEHSYGWILLLFIGCVTWIIHVDSFGRILKKASGPFIHSARPFAMHYIILKRKSRVFFVCMRCSDATFIYTLYSCQSIRAYIYTYHCHDFFSPIRQNRIISANGSIHLTPLIDQWWHLYLGIFHDKGKSWRILIEVKYFQSWWYIVRRNLPRHTHAIEIASENVRHHFLIRMHNYWKIGYDCQGCKVSKCHIYWRCISHSVYYIYYVYSL